MVLDAKRAFLHADALTETCVKPPHLRDKERMLSTEERQVRHTPRSSGLATPGRHWDAQVKLLSVCTRACNARFAHGCAW